MGMRKRTPNIIFQFNLSTDGEIEKQTIEINVSVEMDEDRWIKGCGRSYARQEADCHQNSYFLKRRE